MLEHSHEVISKIILQIGKGKTGLYTLQGANYTACMSVAHYITYFESF